MLSTKASIVKSYLSNVWHRIGHTYSIITVKFMIEKKLPQCSSKNTESKEYIVECCVEYRRCKVFKLRSICTI